MRWFAVDPASLNGTAAVLAVIATVLAFVLHRGLIEVVTAMAVLGVVSKLTFG